ncbi:hypothetical protein D3C80_2072660 [compost metagenome]
MGIAVTGTGNSSVHYALAVFVEGEPEACAAGRFTHVFVDRREQRAVAIPGKVRRALELLAV